MTLIPGVRETQQGESLAAGSDSTRRRKAAQSEKIDFERK